MKRNLWIAFITALLYLFSKWGLFPFSDSAFMQFYFRDLLCLPFVLSLSSVLMASAYNRKEYRLSKLKVFTAFLLVSLLFEWILPSQSEGYDSDYIDVLCYFLGALFYYYLSSDVKKPQTL